MKGWILDALIKNTVRDILFPGLSDTPQTSPSSRDAQGSNFKKENVSIPPRLPFIVGQHHAYVMSYMHWSDARLLEEKSVLKQYLQTVGTKSKQVDSDCLNDCNNMVLDILETYVLLKLFLSERTRNREALSLPLLHTQLLVYAKYFEKTKRRKIEKEEDVRPIQNMYTYFVTTNQA